MRNKQLKKYILNETGLGFSLTLTLMLAMMKFVKFIEINWLWVFSPLWTIAAIDVFFILVFAIFLRNKH